MRLAGRTSAAQEVVAALHRPGSAGPAGVESSGGSGDFGGGGGGGDGLPRASGGSGDPFAASGEFGFELVDPPAGWGNPIQLEQIAAPLWVQLQTPQHRSALLHGACSSRMGELHTAVSQARHEQMRDVHGLDREDGPHWVLVSQQALAAARARTS